MVKVYTTQYNEAVAKAFEFMRGISPEYLRCDWLIGRDPLSTGYGNYGEATGDGRSYKRVPHVLYPVHRTDKRDVPPMIALPHTTSSWYNSPETIVHEMGHVVDFWLGFKHMASPVTAYARTNRREAFAEAFSAWICPQHYGDTRPDERSIRLFTELGITQNERSFKHNATTQP